MPCHAHASVAGRMSALMHVLATRFAHSDLLAEHVEAMLDEVAAMSTADDHMRDETKNQYPLLRLKVDYTGYSTLNPQKFGARYVDRVANPGSLLKFHSRPRKRKDEDTRKDSSSGPSQHDQEEGLATDVPSQIQSLVSEFLVAGGAKEQLRLLPQDILDTAVFDGFVGKEDKNAISESTEAWLAKMQQRMASEISKQGFGQGQSRKDQEILLEQLARSQSEGHHDTSANARRSANEHRPTAQRAPADTGAGSHANIDADAHGLEKEAPHSDLGDSAAGRGAREAAARPSIARSSARSAASSSRGRSVAAGKGSRGRGRQTTLYASYERGVAHDVVDLDSGDDDGGGMDAEYVSSSTAGGKRAVSSGSSARSKRAKVPPTKHEGSEEDAVDDGGSDYEDLHAIPSSKRSSAFSSRRRVR